MWRPSCRAPAPTWACATPATGAGRPAHRGRRRAWGADIGPDETPLEAGLMAFVCLDKPGFIGRDALLAAQAQPLRKRLVGLVVDDPAVYLWGGEALRLHGAPAHHAPIGELSSAGHGWRAGRAIGLAWGAG